MSGILYYEVLDIPLPQLERLKSLKVVFYSEKVVEVSQHQVRLPKESTVGDVLDAIAQEIGGSCTGSDLRLLEVFYHKIFKVCPLPPSLPPRPSPHQQIPHPEGFDALLMWLVCHSCTAHVHLRLSSSSTMFLIPCKQLLTRTGSALQIFSPNERIDSINDQYWTLRAEMIPQAERQLALGAKLIHVYHFSHDSTTTTVVQNFGDPFFMVVYDGETLAQLKPRLQQKLGVKDEEVLQSLLLP